MDLVERLRNSAHNAEALADVGTDAAGIKLDRAQKVAQRAGAKLEREAADEISRLRAALKVVQSYFSAQAGMLSGRELQVLNVVNQTLLSTREASSGSQ